MRVELHFWAAGAQCSRIWVQRKCNDDDWLGQMKWEIKWAPREILPKDIDRWNDDSPGSQNTGSHYGPLYFLLQETVLLCLPTILYLNVDRKSNPRHNPCVWEICSQFWNGAKVAEFEWLLASAPVGPTDLLHISICRKTCAYFVPMAEGAFFLKFSPGHFCCLRTLEPVKKSKCPEFMSIGFSISIFCFRLS